MGREARAKGLYIGPISSSEHARTSLLAFKSRIVMWGGQKNVSPAAGFLPSLNNFL